MDMDDDCVILEGDPDIVPTSIRNISDADTNELIVVSEKGKESKSSSFHFLSPRDRLHETPVKIVANTMHQDKLEASNLLLHARLPAQLTTVNPRRLEPRQGTHGIHQAPVSLRGKQSIVQEKSRGARALPKETPGESGHGRVGAPWLLEFKIEIYVPVDRCSVNIKRAYPPRSEEDESSPRGHKKITNPGGRERTREIARSDNLYYVAK